MPKMLADGNRRLAWVPDGGIADVSAPTVTELTATGVLIIGHLVTANNFTLGPSGSEQINEPALTATGNSTAPGRTNFEAAMNFFRWTDVAEDEAWQTFTSKGLGGLLVQRIGAPRTAKEPFAAGDEVEVYTSITDEPQMQPPPANGGYELFRQVFHVQGEAVDLRAVVAAGV